MAINNIHKIALVTDDVEAAVNFYTQTLGLEVMERFPTKTTMPLLGQETSS